MKLSILTVVVATLISGCAYNVPVQPVSAESINIYSSYENKVPGQFAVVFDENIRNVNREVRPMTEVCGPHSYPISLSDSIAVSVKHTLDLVFEQPVELATMPASETMKKLGLRGVVLVKMADFSPMLVCSPGRGCSGSTNISFGVNISSINGALLGTLVSGSKTIDVAESCSGGARALSESITGATRTALERLATEASNSLKLRPSEAR